MFPASFYGTLYVGARSVDSWFPLTQAQVM